MSDWLLYHVWGIRGYKVARCEMVDRERVLVMLEATPAVLRCPCCGTKDVIRKGQGFQGVRIHHKFRRLRWMWHWWRRQGCCWIQSFGRLWSSGHFV